MLPGTFTYHRWTPEQILFLKEKFRAVGDTELSEMLNSRWPQNWTKKHVEKKRSYLRLKRTKEEIENIRLKNIRDGRFKICVIKRWQKTRVTPEGQIKYWNTSYGRVYPVIKINGSFLHWNRWAWEMAYGQIPAGMNVVFRDDNPYHLSVDNLELITDGQLSARNSVKASQGLSDNYVIGMLTHKAPHKRAILKKLPGFIELKRKSLLLNRTLCQTKKS